MKKVKKVKGMHQFKWKQCPYCGEKNKLAARRCKDCSFWFVKHCKGCGHPNTWEAEECHACNEPFFKYCRKDGGRIIEDGGMGFCEEKRHELYRICPTCGAHYPPILERCPMCHIRTHGHGGGS